MTTEAASCRRRLLSALAVAAMALASACTSATDAGLGMTPPGAIASGGDVAGGTGGISSSPGPALAATASAGTALSGPVQFLPVVGAPADKVSILSEALARSAAAKGVEILPSDGAVAPLRLKGYLSALAEGSGTIVVYVWDVVDPQGNRVSRIQGQEHVAGTAADPWSAVGPGALADIAGKTIDEFLKASQTSG